jgi:hypothetical protein
VLGWREGTAENAPVVNSLWSELIEPGLDWATPCPYILDGGKALQEVVKQHAGEAAFLQRCQAHQKRNGGRSPSRGI